METRSLNPELNTMTGNATTRAHDALDTAVDKVMPAVNRIVDKAHATIDRVAENAGPAAESMQNAVQRASDTSTKLVEACANSVRAKPLRAVISAVVLGYIVGKLMR